MSGQRYPAARPPGEGYGALALRRVSPRASRPGAAGPSNLPAFVGSRRPAAHRGRGGGGGSCGSSVRTRGNEKRREGRAGRTTVPPPVAPLPVSSSKDQTRAAPTIPAPVRVEPLPALDSRAGGAGGRAGGRGHRLPDSPVLCAVPPPPKSLVRRPVFRRPLPGGRCVRFPRETAVVGNQHSPAAIPASVAPAR